MEGVQTRVIRTGIDESLLVVRGNPTGCASGWSELEAYAVRFAPGGRIRLIFENRVGGRRDALAGITPRRDGFCLTDTVLDPFGEERIRVYCVRVDGDDVARAPPLGGTPRDFLVESLPAHDDGRRLVLLGPDRCGTADTWRFELIGDADADRTEYVVRRSGLDFTLAPGRDGDCPEGWSAVPLDDGWTGGSYERFLELLAR